MELERKEILSGVWLTAQHTDKFKTGLMSLNLLSQLTRESAAPNAVIPSVLRRGTVRNPDMASLACLLDELYGSVMEPAVRRFGEIQSAGFVASFPEDVYVPGDSRLLERCCGLLGDMLLSPNTRGGLFLPDYVAGEKQKLIERIRAKKNDKRRYAIQRLIENMCAYEDYATGSLGDEETAETIHYARLTRHYRELLAVSPIEIYYCGAAEFGRLEDALSLALEGLPRGETDYDIGTDVRMNAVTETPRVFVEEADVTQGKLAIGWRLGEVMEDPDPAALRVFNAVFGGSVTSKLFTNVRERLSLCYYASSLLELNKGLLIVSSGIDFDKYDAARDEIFAQLDAMKAGEISAYELQTARLGAASDLRAAADDASQLESYWMAASVSGTDCPPDELAALCEVVTKDELVAIANSVECDSIYFLKGGEEPEDDEQEL